MIKNVYFCKIYYFKPKDPDPKLLGNAGFGSVCNEYRSTALIACAN